MSDLSLTAHQLTLSLGKKICLDHISLALEPGDFLGIAGPNGAGKSTLLKALLGRVPCDEGTIFLNGQPLNELSPSTRGQNIAYLPQERLFPYGCTAEDVILLGRLPYRKEKTHQTHIITEAVIRTLNLQDLRLRRVETLSGGEKARVALARALAVGSPFLLIDEPIASLDPAHAIQMMDLLSRKAKEEQRAICIVLHDLSLAAQYCTKIAFLKQGRLVAHGLTKDVMTEKNLHTLYEINIKIINHIPVLLRAE